MNQEPLEKLLGELLVKLSDAFITEHRKIFCYRRPDGSCPAKEFLENATNRAKASFAQMFKTHCQGHQLRGDRWKPLQNCEGLFEYKDNGTQTRIIHAMDVGQFVILLYGFGGKKENKIKPGHIKRAEDLRDEFLVRKDEILSRKKGS